MRKNTTGKKPVKKIPRADFGPAAPAELYTSPPLLMRYRAAARKAKLIWSYFRTEFCGPDGVWSEGWTLDEPPTYARVGIIRTGDEETVTWGLACANEHVPWIKSGVGLEIDPVWTRYACTKLAEQAELIALEKACPEACVENC